MLRVGQFRAPSPLAAAPLAGRWFKNEFSKTGGKRARSSAAPGAEPGMISPSATRSAIYTANTSSQAESRGQVFSLSSGSCYSISAMLAPRVFENERSPPWPPRPARHSAPGSRAGASDASRARARRPRGAMLAILGFQSTAPAARRGEKWTVSNNNYRMNE